MMENQSASAVTTTISLRQDGSPQPGEAGAPKGGGEWADGLSTSKLRWIRAVYNFADRDTAVSLFSEPGRNIKAHAWISATAFSLHHSSFSVIFMDSPSNAQTALRTSGRVPRIGQQRISQTYVLGSIIATTRPFNAAPPIEWLASLLA